MPSIDLSRTSNSHSVNKSLLINIPIPPDPHLADFNCFLLLKPYQIYPSNSIISQILSFVPHTNIILGLTNSKVDFLMLLFSVVQEFTFHEAILKLPEHLLL